MSFIIGIEWKPIPGFEPYEVSERGDVRKRINVNHPERRQYAHLKPETDKDGYLRVNIKRKHMLVHRIVFLAFRGELVNGLVVCHLDGNRTNNHPSNLAQLTQKENIGHKKLHGTWQAGEQHPRAKLTNKQAALIQRHVQEAPKTRSGRLARGAANEIALLAGVSKQSVFAISRSRSSYAQ